MNPKLIHAFALLTAIAGGVLASADRIVPLAAISPELAHYWPFVLGICGHREYRKANLPSDSGCRTHSKSASSEFSACLHPHEMKNILLNIMGSILLPIYCVSCTGLTLNSQQQTALNDVGKTALDAGLGYLNGGQAGAIAGAAPDLAGDVSDAALALRTQETPGATTAPSATQINSVIASISGSPAVAKALGPKVSAAIKTAVISGTPPNVAIETAAKGLDQAAAKS